MGPRCKCNRRWAMKCNEITERQSEGTFKKSGIVRGIRNNGKKTIARARGRKTENQSRWKYSYVFFLASRILVSKTMHFPSRNVGHYVIEKSIMQVTLQMTWTNVQVLLGKLNSKNKQVYKIFPINSPKVGSHFCRQPVKKLYLERKWQMEKELY